MTGMMVSTKGRYALRIMIDLAKQEEEGNVPLSEIARRQEISVKYLEAVMAILNRAGLVVSRMGKNGGYRLTKPPAQYRVGEILRLTEGRLAPVHCLEDGEVNCSRSEGCVTLPMWKELDRLISEYLDHLTLEDLIQGNVKWNPEK